MTTQASLISAWLLGRIAREFSLLSHRSLVSSFSQCLYVVRYIKVLALDLQLLTSAVTQIMDAGINGNNVAIAEISS